MSQQLQKLLRITPQCEARPGRAGRCRKDAAYHLEITHPKRTVPQRADLCRDHFGQVADAARKEGYAVRVT